MSSKFDNDEKPIKWYTFHSDKCDRDYYYEPNTKVVTWIRPAELHTHPVVPETPKQQEESVVERRVSFHSSVDQDAEDRIIEMGASEEQQVESNDTLSGRRSPLLTVVLLLCTVVLTASYMGWLPRGPLGSAFFGEGAPKTDDIRPKKVDRTSHKRDHGSEKESIHMKASNTRDSEHGRIKAHVSMEGDDIEKKARAIDASDQSHHTTPKPRREERQRAKIQRKEERVETDNIGETANGRHEETEVPRRKKACLVPFAHVFSRECRKIIAQRPVYDMDALLDSLI